MEHSPDEELIVNVAVIAPLRQTYDYRYRPREAEVELRPGCRIWVPFGASHRVGIVLKVSPVDDTARQDLKHIPSSFDGEVLLSASMLKLAQWAANYYHYPIGEVLGAMLPTWLRRKRDIPRPPRTQWRITPAGRAMLDDGSVRGARQIELMTLIAAHEHINSEQLAGLEFDWRAAMRRTISRGWVEICEDFIPTDQAIDPAQLEIAPGVVLNCEQARAVSEIRDHRGQFAAFALNGVTGSGKTEVYLEAIVDTLRAGRRALVLVPEIALTQQLVQRFKVRFASAVGVLHSGLGERQRVMTWDACRRGEVSVLIGTRSAVWASMPKLGLIIVDEEHDASFKQQEGFRYSARDLAVVRAQHANIPVVLGSATPALETLHNIARKKFTELSLEQRANAATMPEVRCIDVRGLKQEHGLSPRLLEAMREHLGRGEQVILFLNRRGYAPLLICRNCGELRRCDRCDAYLVHHKQARAARCHHCDRQWPLARATNCCDDEVVAPIGVGTERVEEAVAEFFPDHQARRVDRDSVRRAGAFDQILADVAAHRIDILIGTQMVAKGLDFSDVTLVGIVDADSRLYSVDFRAEERLAQLLVQVAGRAGRARKQGTVLIQTHHPDHPVLQRIIRDGYRSYADYALSERREVGLPPYASMVVVRAESKHSNRAIEFLTEVRQQLAAELAGHADISFPIPALMERRAGRYRALVVLSSTHRVRVGRGIAARMASLERLGKQFRVRWSLDIDPQDTL